MLPLPISVAAVRTVLKLLLVGDGGLIAVEEGPGGGVSGVVEPARSITGAAELRDEDDALPDAGGPLTNGQYFAAATVDQLKTVYANIGSEVGYEKAEREVTSRFAGYGLAFAVLAALGAISLGAKWP